MLHDSAGTKEPIWASKAIRATLRERLDLPDERGLRQLPCEYVGTHRTLRTAHVQPSKNRLLAFSPANADRIRYEGLRRHLFDYRVPPVHDVDSARCDLNAGADPVARERDAREAEDAVGGGEGRDSSPERFVVRRDLPAGRPSARLRQELHTVYVLEEVGESGLGSCGRARASVGHAVKRASATCLPRHVPATAPALQDASESKVIGIGRLASCC